MALPTTRSISAVDGAPLPASVINELQDAVIQRSHGSIVEARTPLPETGSGALTTVDGVQLNAIGEDAISFIDVPVGAVVTKIEVLAWRSGVAGNMTFVLETQSAPGPSVTNLDTQVIALPTGPLTGATATFTTGLPYTKTSLSRLWLRGSLDDAIVGLWAETLITYSVPIV